MKRIVLIFIGLFLLLPSISYGSMLFYPSPYPVAETAQKAVIWYENGIETLILSTSFRGNAKDFGWLIPVPSKPKVDTASDELYTALEDLTRPKYQVDRGVMEIPYSATGLQEKAPVPQSPTIIDTKVVDVFDITTLSANDEKGLSEWLFKNGYSYPSDRENIIKYYIEQKWYFVAVKVNSSGLGYAQTTLSDGHATPIKLTFSSPNIIYPMKLSGPGIPSSQGKGAKVAAYSFEQGTEGFYGTFSANSLESEQAQGIKIVQSYPRVNLVLDSSNSYHGTFSLKVNPSNTASALPIVAQASLSNLKPGITYTFSAWAKSLNPNTGSVYLTTTSGTTINQSEKKQIGLLKDWQRFTLTFVAPSSYVSIQLTGSNFSEGETVNWDAVQVEEGNSTSDFTEEFLPSRQVSNYSMPIDRVTIQLYVFSDHKKEVPGFTVSYASWVSPKTIEKLAFTPDGGQPWIAVKQKTYLTKLYRQMRPSEMTTDLILRDAENNDSVNADSFPEVSTFRFIAVIVLVLVLEIMSIAGFIWYKKKKVNSPPD